MPADRGPVVQDAMLRSELVRLRKDRNLTQLQVAEALAWSPSKLIRIEGGHGAITGADLDALLSQYGMTSESSRDRFHAFNHDARERGWWNAYRDHLSPTYLRYVSFEAGAASIRQFQIGFIPGLLQTAGYAGVVTAAGSADADWVTPATELRLQRQSQLANRSEPPHQLFLIDEAVIRRWVGVSADPAIMPDQLRRIADRAEQDELVTVQVIPFGAGAHPGLFGAFTLLGFDGALPDLLYLDMGRGAFSLAVGDDPRVSEYAADFERLLESALPPGESTGLIREAAGQMS